jgi:ankyrin repeat protein
MTQLVQQFLNAAKSGNIGQIDQLITNDPSLINAKNNNGLTAIHMAAGGGHNVAIDHLILKGSDVNVKTSDGSTAIHIAAMTGRNTTIDHLILKGLDVNAKNNSGSTAIHAAAVFGRNTTIDHLILKGLDVNAKTNDGATAIHIAAHYGRNTTIDHLILKGLDVNDRTNDGRTAIHTAAAFGRNATIDHLILKGLDVNAKTNTGLTAFHVAITFKKIPTVTHLLNLGCEISQDLVTDDPQIKALTDKSKLADQLFNMSITTPINSIDQINLERFKSLAIKDGLPDNLLSFIQTSQSTTLQARNELTGYINQIKANYIIISNIIEHDLTTLLQAKFGSQVISYSDLNNPKLPYSQDKIENSRRLYKGQTYYTPPGFFDALLNPNMQSEVLELLIEDLDIANKIFANLNKQVFDRKIKDKLNQAYAAFTNVEIRSECALRAYQSFKVKTNERFEQQEKENQKLREILFKTEEERQLEKDKSELMQAGKANKNTLDNYWRNKASASTKRSIDVADEAPEAKRVKPSGGVELS